MILAATVEELAGKEKVASLYSGIATEEYGKNMVNIVKNEAYITQFTIK